MDMIKCELEDGSVRYVPSERVILINPHPESGLRLQFMNAKNEPAGMRIKRFMILKSGTWYE